MSLELEHLALYELLYVPCSSIQEKKLLSMSRPLVYGGTFVDLWSLVHSGKLEKGRMIRFITIYLVKNDKERFDVTSFVVVDVDGVKIIIYILESREIVFLIRCPERMKDKCPWEVIFKSVHGEPQTFQVHFEFTSNPILPDWYNVKRSTKVKRTEFMHMQG